MDVAGLHSDQVTQVNDITIIDKTVYIYNIADMSIVGLLYNIADMSIV